MPSVGLELYFTSIAESFIFKCRVNQLSPGFTSPTINFLDESYNNLYCTPLYITGYLLVVFLLLLSRKIIRAESFNSNISLLIIVSFGLFACCWERSYNNSIRCDLFMNEALKFRSTWFINGTIIKKI